MWLKIENKINPQNPATYLRCRDKEELKQALKRYSTDAYKVTEYSSDPRGGKITNTSGKDKEGRKIKKPVVL